MISYSFSAIEAHALTIKIGAETVLDEASFTINSGEMVAILGPSGSGKTTLLRTIAGFLDPIAGRLKIGGQEINRTPPVDRSVAMLFQKPALFPFKTVSENALAARFAKRASREELARGEAIVGQLADIFEMTPHLNKPICTLSGGQEQRAAIIRCLSNAQHQELILLDEPFKSTLDYSLRWRIMDAVKEWHKAHPSKTIVIVTHDFIEAAYLCDRVGVFFNKQLVLETPKQLYASSPNLDVASILGPINKIEITPPRRLIIADLITRIQIPRSATHFAFRPANVEIRKEGGSFDVLDCTYMGDYQRVKLKATSDESMIFEVDAPLMSSFSFGERIGILVSRDGFSFYDIRGDRL